MCVCDHGLNRGLTASDIIKKDTFSSLILTNRMRFLTTA